MMEREPNGPQGGPSIRLVRRNRDGTLHDVALDRPVTLTELAEDVKDGRRFRAVRAESGANCTSEVLLEVVRAALLHPARLPAVGAPGTDLLDEVSRFLTLPRFGSERP